MRETQVMPEQKTLEAEDLFVMAAAAILIVTAVLLRISWYPIVTSDYTYFTRLWFEALQNNPGLTAFAYPFSNYAPAYLYAIKALNVIPVSSLYSLKSLSVLGDIMLAIVATRILLRSSFRRASTVQTLMLSAIFFALPTVMVNSALWGQSDALYTVPLLLSLYFLLEDRPFPTAFWFGVAFAIKLQSIFFLPVLVGYLLQKRSTARYLLVPPVMFILSLVPALLGGGSLPYWLLIYFHEAQEYPYLTLSAPNFYAFIEKLPFSADLLTFFFWLGIALAFAVSLWIMLYMRRTRPFATHTVLALTLTSVLFIPYLLPRMHERYFYVADVISVIYALVEPRRWILPFLVIGASFLSYLPYLSSQVPSLSAISLDLRFPAVLMTTAALILLVDWLHSARPLTSSS
jgi:Gpi18-like mannosyltransferase